MNRTQKFSLPAALALAAALAGCANNMLEPDFGTLRARQALTALQANPQLAGRAPEAIAEAEQAVVAAENPPDSGLAAHLGYIAERKVQIAQNLAMSRFAESQLSGLTQERDRLLAARASQADLARAEASQQVAMLTAEKEALRREMLALNARQTERGYVLTLGDVLFATAQADLKPGAASNLDKLVDFLTKDSRRAVTIEGHTDSVGNEAYNQGLSQRRAEAVRSYLVSKGVGSNQVQAVGRGEAFPVAPNDNVGGRQQNRRIEVVIQNPDEA